MGRAYKCDRCDSYFDGLVALVGGQYPSRYSGVVLDMNAEPQNKLRVGKALKTYLCPDCSIRFAAVFLEFMEEGEKLKASPKGGP